MPLHAAVRTVVQAAPHTVLHLAAAPRGLCRISFFEDLPAEWPCDDSNPILREAARQLTSYFAGNLREFDLPLELKGTPFQERVWNTLLTIPYGQTISYAKLAEAVGSPKAFRAVGSANGKNPIPIVVPCHLVIQSGGGLGGFSCGIAYKRRLLDLEQTDENSRFELR